MRITGLHLDKEKSEIDETFLQIGYRKAGGMWGNAQWFLSADRDVVVSIVNADKFLQAPASEDRPCIVMIHTGPFTNDWLEEWDADNGHLNPPRHLKDDTISTHLYPNLAMALTFCAGLKLGLSRHHKHKGAPK